MLNKNYPILAGNIVASIVFFITGVTALFLLRTGQLSSEGMEGFTKFIQTTGGDVNQLLGNSIWLNVGFAAIVVLFIYLIAKKL